MKKSIFITLCSLLICAVFPLRALAAPIVVFDGQEISFDVLPALENDLIMVPIRPIFEAMGAAIDWNQETRTAKVVKGEFTLILPIGSTAPSINGQGVPIEAPIKIVNDRMLAPVRFVSEAFGGTFSEGTRPSPAIYIASAEINKPYDAIQKKIADKYAQDITGLNKVGWLDKINLGKELSETERSNYIVALIDIVNQYREIGSKMPVIYFDEGYFKTVILYQDAQGYAVKIVVISEEGLNGREWEFDSIERK